MFQWLSDGIDAEENSPQRHVASVVKWQSRFRLRLSRTGFCAVNSSELILRHIDQDAVGVGHLILAEAATGEQFLAHFTLRIFLRAIL